MARPQISRGSKLKWLLPAGLLCMTMITWWWQHGADEPVEESAATKSQVVYFTPPKHGRESTRDLASGAQPATDTGSQNLDGQVSSVAAADASISNEPPIEIPPVNSSADAAQISKQYSDALVSRAVAMPGVASGDGNLVDSQQAPAIPADGFKINGRLFSPAGEPAAGVRIHAVPVDATPPDVMWTTLSKDDGTYELTGLNPGRYRLETKSFAYDAVPTVFFGWAGSRGVDITLVAKDGGIRNSTGSGFAADALSDDERVIVQSQPRQFAPPSSPHEARAPRPKFDVTGSVISALLFPVAGAEVRLSSVAKGSVYVTRTNQQGEFLLPGVVAGNDYHLRIAAANNQHYARRRLRIGGDIVPIDVIMASAPTASLAGRVLDTQRNPVAGMPLLVTSSHGAGAAHRVTTDDDGRFAIARIAAGKILFLSHSLPNFRARGLTLHHDTRGEAELIVDRGERRVTGTVRQPRGQLLADSEVSLRWQTTRRGVTSYMVHNATTDRRGRFQFTGVGDGRHTLDARAAGIGSARRVVSIADLNDDVSVDLLP